MLLMTNLRRTPPVLLALIGLLAVVVLLLSLQGGAFRTGPASAASGGPEMALTVTDAGYCVGSDCYAEVGQDFKLGVDFVEAPAAGYSVMQTFIDYGSLTYSPTAAPANEFTWPDGAMKLRNNSFLANSVWHGGTTGGSPLQVSEFEGIAIEFTLTCGPSPSSTTVSLLLDGPSTYTTGSKFGYVDAMGAFVEVTPKVNPITVHCIVDTDTDGDGCGDIAESRSDPALGGDRDWQNPWDFYDVAIGGGAPGQDGIVDLFNDIIGVINHLGLAPGPPYDVQYDRGPWTGANSWKGTLPPDGTIDLFNDRTGVIAQYGHDCS